MNPAIHVCYLTWLFISPLFFIIYFWEIIIVKLWHSHWLRSEPPSSLSWLSLCAPSTVQHRVSIIISGGPASFVPIHFRPHYFVAAHSRPASRAQQWHGTVYQAQFKQKLRKLRHYRVDEGWRWIPTTVWRILLADWRLFAFFSCCCSLVSCIIFYQQQQQSKILPLLLVVVVVVVQRRT